MNQNKEMNIDNPHVMENQSTYKEYTGKKSLSNKIAIALAIIVSSVVVVFLAIGMIKSHNRAKYKDESYVQQEVTRYLQERYNEEFIVYYERGMDGAYNYVQLYAYPIVQQDDAHEIKIQGYYNKWGKMDFYDDYVMVRLTEEYEACVDKIVNQYFNKYKLFLEFNAEWVTSELSPSITLDELLELEANVDYPLPDLAIFLDASQKPIYTEENIKEMAYRLAEWGYRGSIHTACYEIDELYQKKNNENKRKNTVEDMNNSEWHVLFIYDDKIDYR